MIARALVATTSLALLGCSSSSAPKPSEEVLKRTDGEIGVTVRVSTTRANTPLGKGIAHDNLAMDVFRGKEWMAGPGLACPVADKKTVEVRLDAARGVLAHRCKPGDAWTVDRIGETAYHRDCEANGGTAAEPDLAATKTLIDRAGVLAKCAVDPKLSGMERNHAMLTLAIDFNRASKSDARTAELLLSFLDDILAMNEDAHLWPEYVWDMEALKGIKSAERQTLPPTVYPELQRQAVARLAKATSPNEVLALASVADGRDPRFPDSATNALKAIVALPASGRNEAIVSLLLGPMLTTAPDRAAKIGCDALRGGYSKNATAALAAAKAKPACPALATAVQALPDYSKKWLDEECAKPTPPSVIEFPASILDDKWKRATLSNAAFQANPQDLAPWPGGMIAAGCPPKTK